MEKKKRPPFVGKKIVIIPIGIIGPVSDNCQLLDDKIEEFITSHPDIKLGDPQYNITPSSGGRGVSIDSISFLRLA